MAKGKLIVAGVVPGGVSRLAWAPRSGAAVSGALVVAAGVVSAAYAGRPGRGSFGADLFTLSI